MARLEVKTRELIESVEKQLFHAHSDNTSTDDTAFVELHQLVDD
jgi:hypothetical protein